MPRARLPDPRQASFSGGLQASFPSAQPQQGFAMTSSCQDLLPISVATLAPVESGLGIELFHQDSQANHYVLYRGISHPLRQDDLARLRASGCQRLYISSAARQQYQAYLRELVGLEGAGHEASMEVRINALNEVVRDVLETAFRGNDTEQTDEACQRLGKLTSEIIDADAFSEDALFQVLRHDYATFTHSANVAFYAGVLAKQLGYAESEIQQIIVGGLLHDLGKLDIPERILAKPGKLDHEEYQEIQRHPALGMQKLADRSDLTEGQLMMVYQHHERPDGGGYPSAVVDDEIHPWAKLCAVVDVYEALTSHRPYRRPMARQLVHEILTRDSGKAFDSEILKCWVSITQTSLRS